MQRQNLRYPDVSLQVVLENASEITAALDTILCGWAPSVAPAPSTLTAHTVLWKLAEGYSTQSHYIGETISGLGVAGAACAVIADLAQDYFETRPGCLALHCAAFRYNNRLIAMTGPARAGKSTLAARLTQEPDIEVFCDDVLPMSADGQAVGLGIAPRLRLPLPATASSAFRDHVARNLGPHDDSYGYVCAPTVAPHGTRAPLSVLLILDRRDTAPARLHAVAEDEALHFLLSQNMSDLQTAESAFARLSNLLAGITCLRLVYSDLDEAVALMRHAFGNSAPVAAGVEVGAALAMASSDRLPRAKMSPDICWSRSSDVVMQHRADSAFLWQPGKQMIWHMNTLAMMVWTLLEIPGSAREIAQLLAEQFPETGETALIRDVNALLLALAQDGLIEAAGASQPAT